MADSSPVSPPASPSARSPDRQGFAAAILAFAIWGLFPIYLFGLTHVSALQITAHRDRLVLRVRARLAGVPARARKHVDRRAAGRRADPAHGERVLHRGQLARLRLGRQSGSRARREPRVLHRTAAQRPFRRPLAVGATRPHAMDRRGFRGRGCRLSDARGGPCALDRADRRFVFCDLRLDPQDRRHRRAAGSRGRDDPARAFRGRVPALVRSRRAPAPWVTRARS